MGKSLILFLNFFVITHFCFCQAANSSFEKCDCTSKKIRDSLIVKYIDNGANAEKTDYNSPIWQSYCDSLIKICPNIAVSYQLKALPFIKMGDYATAFPLEDKAVELAPKEYTAYRGFLKCIFTKDYEAAITDFRKAQQLTPGNYEMDHTYLFYEGLCNLELKQYHKAEQNFKQDILIQTGGDPNKNIHFNSLLYIGILYYEMHKDERAKEYLVKCLLKYKELPDANYYLALIYKRERNIELQNKYFQIARQSKAKGYGLNEGNVYYVYYPHQITLYEINKALEE
jgi:tetratricopeptide (TPR) repeat protein